MPIRSRSHELEDESIDRFKASVPRRWVCREKGRDYGVDMEVEIFGEDRTATGLMFYVQLKATDDIKRERKMPIEVDRIRYLQSLELPAIIVRYCSASDGLFWLWDFEAFSQANPDAASATIKFLNEWTKETPEKLHAVLKVIRRLNERRSGERFALSAKYVLSYSSELAAAQALNAVLGQLSFIQQVDDDSRVPIEVSFFADHIRIAIGRGFVDIEIQYDATRTRQILAYAFCAVLSRIGFNDRAASAANYCLTLGDAVDVVPRELSIYACIALKGEPLKAAKLAVLAGMHHHQDPIFLAFTTELLTGHAADRSEIAAAIQEFYLPALALAPTDDTRAAIMYSMGNVRANNQQTAKALEAFNAARKLRPKYLSSDYFFKELGGVLFERGRYRCSAIAYRRSVELSAEPNAVFCLGDALYFSGEFLEASSFLNSVAPAEDVGFAPQARLKKILADWFIEDEVIQRPGDADALSRLADEIRTAEGKLPAILAAAFAARGNAYLWSWAIHFSVIVAPHYFVSDVLVCAQEACGSDAYAMCRERILPMFENENELEQIDGLHAQASDRVTARRPRPYVARLLGEEESMVFEKDL